MQKAGTLKVRPLSTINNVTVNNFWKKRDENLAGILLDFDQKEKSWTLSEEHTVRASLQSLLKIVQDLEMCSDRTLQDYRADLVYILAYLPTSWFFFIMNWLSDFRNAVMTSLFTYSFFPPTEDDNGDYLSSEALFRDRILALRAASVISQIFSTQRIEMIDQFCASYENGLYQDKAEQ